MRVRNHSLFSQHSHHAHLHTWLPFDQLATLCHCCQPLSIHTRFELSAQYSIRSHFFPFTSMAMFIFFFYLFCCLLGVSCSFGEPTTGKRGENYINNDGVKLFHLFFRVAFLLCLSLFSILKGGSMEVRETNSWRLFLRSPFLYSYPGTIPCTLYFPSLLFSLSELFKG